MAYVSHAVRGGSPISGEVYSRGGEGEFNA